MASSAYGIDLGTCNIKIYGKGDESVFCQKNIIAIENKDILFAYGDEAFDMYEKAPGNIHISYPLCNGVIADIKNMQTLVKCFITDLGGGSVKPADYYIAVPTDVTEVEKRAFYDLVKNANVKAKRVMVVEKAIADRVGHLESKGCRIAGVQLQNGDTGGAHAVRFLEDRTTDIRMDFLHSACTHNRIHRRFLLIKICKFFFQLHYSNGYFP